jgi:hypothetical protein
MLGAGLGPAGNSQSLAVDWFGPRSRYGVFLERRARNQRFFYDQISAMFREDVEIAGDARFTHARGGFELDARLGVARRFNSNFGPHVTAPRAAVAVTWLPGSQPGRIVAK